MLDILWKLRGSVPLDGMGTDEAVMTRLVFFLEDQGKQVSERYNTQVAFDPIVLGIKWWRRGRTMDMFERGRFWIDQGVGGRTLDYELRSLRNFLIGLFGAGMFFIFGIWPHGDVALGLEFGTGALAWLGGVPFLVSRAIVPGRIRSAVRGWIRFRGATPIAAPLRGLRPTLASRPRHPGEE
jgi:hypothetical protein